MFIQLNVRNPIQHETDIRIVKISRIQEIRPANITGSLILLSGEQDWIEVTESIECLFLNMNK